MGRRSRASSLVPGEATPARAADPEVAVSDIIALVVGDTASGPTGAMEPSLRAALAARGLVGQVVGWEDPAVEWSRFTLALVRSTGPTSWDRERLLGAARQVGAATALWNPAEVLRWNSHRSYLLELEERGAPIPPTAWLARGDEVELATLLAARGWDAVVISPAVPGAAGSVHVSVAEDRDASRATTGEAGVPPATSVGEVTDGIDLQAGQHHLDRLLACGDVLVQSDLTATGGGRRSVIVIDGRVSHAVPAADPDSAALARWVVEATGVELLYARVDLIDDASRNPQVLEMDAVAPELDLGQTPQAADALAAAIHRRVGG